MLVGVVEIGGFPLVDLQTTIFFPRILYPTLTLATATQRRSTRPRHCLLHGRGGAKKEQSDANRASGVDEYRPECELGSDPEWLRTLYRLILVFKKIKIGM